MKKARKGSMTVMLALSMLAFITFCLVLMEGMRISFFKVKAFQAMDLAEFSVLSEYQKELFEEYGVFAVDLDYEQGAEQPQLLEQRAGYYLNANAEEVETTTLHADRICRLTDGEGSAFFKQAVEQKKVDSGYKFLEEVMEFSDGWEQIPDLKNLLEDSQNQAEGILGQYIDEEGTALFEISIPDISFPSVDALTEAVLGSTEDISNKSVNPEQRLENRRLQVGEGKKEKISLQESQMFLGYLFDRFDYYTNEGDANEEESLRYQIEYIIWGKADDKKNLEEMIWSVFLQRAGGNYLFYHQDPEIKAEAEAKAVAIAGISGNKELVRLVREILLLVQAIEDGIAETGLIFSGEKVPFYRNGILEKIELGYEEYLYLGLMLTDQKTRIYRAMDIAEMEVRIKSGYEDFCMDHCTDAFYMNWTFRFDSLFRGGILKNVTGYENTIEKRFAYQI